MNLRTAAVFLCLVVIAALFRFPLLAVRPMHCDEAVNADKFGILLEQGRYEYSNQDFHGPTLYYLSLIPAKIQGIRSYIDLSEATLRVVPAFLGVLLVGAHILLIPYFGLRAAAAAGLLTAVSPAMVYYSRYYIHEILLVSLSFCALLCLFGYCRRRRAISAVGTGAFAGLMYATKETAIRDPRRSREAVMGLAAAGGWAMSWHIENCRNRHPGLKVWLLEDSFKDVQRMRSVMRLPRGH